MDTKLEALFRAMLNGGWFTKSNGDVESPLGYFGYVINEKADLFELYQAFEDTINAYGKPDDNDVIGSFIAYIDTVGNITIERETQIGAKLWYENTSKAYDKWADDSF